MADSRFYTQSEPLSLRDIVERVGGELMTDHDPQLTISSIAPLQGAKSDHLSFLASNAYRDQFETSQAGACFIADRALLDAAPQQMALIFVQNPQKAYALIAQDMHQSHTNGSGVHPSAILDPSAKLASGVSVAPGAVIGAGVEIGAQTAIGANTVVGHGVKVGRNCMIAPNVTLSHSLLGDNVRIHSGTQIGQDGFGYTSDAEGHTKIPQLGRVIIQDNVEIGANTTIDRGAADDTVIGAGTKIDNLVHIAHNCTIGQDCILVTMVGLSGSVTLGDRVVLAGKVGVSDHITIADDVTVLARGTVLKDLLKPGKYGGNPARPEREWKREMVEIAKLTRRKSKPQN